MIVTVVVVIVNTLRLKQIAIREHRQQICEKTVKKNRIFIRSIQASSLYALRGVEQSLEVH